MGALARTGVGPGEGSPLGLGLRASGRPVFSLLRPWDWDLVRLRVETGLSRSEGCWKLTNRISCPLFTSFQPNGPSGHNASFPGTGSLEKGSF